MYSLLKRRNNDKNSTRKSTKNRYSKGSGNKFLDIVINAKSKKNVLIKYLQKLELQKHYIVQNTTYINLKQIKLSCTFFVFKTLLS